MARPHEEACGSATDDPAELPFGDLDGDKLCDELDEDDDGDGWPDDFEVDCGFDPLDPNSAPLIPNQTPVSYFPIHPQIPMATAFQTKLKQSAVRTRGIPDIPVDTDFDGYCDAFDPDGNQALAIDYTDADFSPLQSP